MLNFLVLSLALLSTTPSLLQAEKRTDGPPGSEWGDFSQWDGQFSLGARFGATILNNTNGKTTVALGADADYRPTDLFGFRLAFEQSVQKPRYSLIHFTPLIHTDFSNLRPYVFFGPGFRIGQGETKFSLAGGIGGDFMMTDRLGFGMSWTYHWVFDFVDNHSVMARFSFWF